MVPSNDSRAPVVLLVDGVRDNRAMYAEFLRTVGFRAVEIDNTLDALALAVTADIVVTEIRVPGPFDGLELVRRLRSDKPTAQKAIVVLTACAFGEDERMARAAGCDVFLTKPCFPEALAAELRRAFTTRVPRKHPAPVRSSRTRRGAA